MSPKRKDSGDIEGNVCPPSVNWLPKYRPEHGRRGGTGIQGQRWAVSGKRSAVGGQR